MALLSLYNSSSSGLYPGVPSANDATPMDTSTLIDSSSAEVPAGSIKKTSGKLIILRIICLYYTIIPEINVFFKNAHKGALYSTQ